MGQFWARPFRNGLYDLNESILTYAECILLLSGILSFSNVSTALLTSTIDIGPASLVSGASRARSQLRMA